MRKLYKPISFTVVAYLLFSMGMQYHTYSKATMYCNQKKYTPEYKQCWRQKRVAIYQLNK